MEQDRAQAHIAAPKPGDRVKVIAAKDKHYGRTGRVQKPEEFSEFGDIRTFSVIVEFDEGDQYWAFRPSAVQVLPPPRHSQKVSPTEQRDKAPKIRWTTFGKFALTVVAIVGAPICSELARPGPVNLFWFGGQLGAVLLAAGIPAYSARQARRAELDVRSAARLEMTSALEPISRDTAAYTLEDPTKLRDITTHAVLNSAAQLIGPQGKTRSCYYELEPGPPDNRGGSPIPNRLALKHYKGRTSPPVRSFEAGTSRGDQAIELVLDDAYLLCEDVINSPPPGWSDDGDKSYKTFISVAVVVFTSQFTVGYGMLTVDAPRSGDLTERDVDLLRVMARLIATARAIEQEILDTESVGNQE